jgi:hypothetical protein
MRFDNVSKSPSDFALLLILALSSAAANTPCLFSQEGEEHVIVPVAADMTTNYYQPRCQYSSEPTAGGSRSDTLTETQREIIRASWDELHRTPADNHPLVVQSPSRLADERQNVSKPPANTFPVGSPIYFQDEQELPLVGPSRSSNQPPEVRWVRKRISEVRIDIREKANVAPQDRSTELDYGAGDWNDFSCEPKVFAWSAPNLRYQPLYFEDVALERYGQTMSFHRQTLRSAGHFFKSSLFWANNLRHDPPCSCDYPLGFCRPGSATPPIQQKHYLGRPH